MEGKIKWYRKEKGYGFITGDEDNKDYFLHYTSLEEGTDNIDGKSVTFEVKETDRGVQATEIKFLDSDAQSSDDYAEDIEETA